MSAFFKHVNLPRRRSFISLSSGKVSGYIVDCKMVPGNPQKSLTMTNLGGMVEIKPAEEDFYRKLIEQRVSHKKSSKALDCITMSAPRPE